MNKKNKKLFIPLNANKEEKKGLIRDFLLENPSFEKKHQIGFLWQEILYHQCPEVIFEYINAGGKINHRDEKNKGFLHWCYMTKQPDWVWIFGLKKLNGEKWWLPDYEGKTPFHLGPLNNNVIYNMCVNLWIDRISWFSLITEQQGEPIEYALKNGWIEQAESMQKWKK